MKADRLVLLRIRNKIVKAKHLKWRRATARTAENAVLNKYLKSRSPMTTTFDICAECGTGVSGYFDGTFRDELCKKCYCTHREVELNHRLTESAALQDGLLSDFT